MATVKELNVNGGKRAVDADAERTLLSVLRDDLDLMRRLHRAHRRPADALL